MPSKKRKHKLQLIIVSINSKEKKLEKLFGFVFHASSDLNNQITDYGWSGLILHVVFSTSFTVSLYLLCYGRSVKCLFS